MATNLFFDLWVLDAKQFTPTWCFLTSMTTDQSCLSFVKTDYVSVQIQNNVEEGHLLTNHQQHIVTTIIITAKGDCGELSTHVEELWWIPGLCCWSSASKRNWTSCSLRQVSLRAAEGKTIIWMSPAMLTFIILHATMVTRFANISQWKLFQVQLVLAGDNFASQFG